MPDAGPAVMGFLGKQFQEIDLRCVDNNFGVMPI
tara:strand:- start:312 stop:413 length:102 start_codon:yes stop_codon:yes gene_type:complete